VTPPTLVGHAFGLAVVAREGFGGLVPFGEAPPARSVTLCSSSAHTFDDVASSERVVDLRYPDGRAMMSIDRRHDGYLVRAPRHGSHLVSLDGSSIATTRGGRGWRWQRLFYAQVLPLAAALQGLEVLHASAVVAAGSAIACIAASGTGKTSIAAHLVDLGATPLTDDVLALERHGAELLAHPGAAFANVDKRELAAMSPAGRDRLGASLASSDKVHVTTRVHRDAVPLGAVCFLRRGERLEVRRDAAPPTRSILAAGFLTHLRTPERLLTHLELSSVLASGVPTYDVVLPEGGHASDAAAAIGAAVTL
jgi:hypothetical protein